MRNPLATEGQFAAERDVAAMLDTDAFRRAQATCAALFDIAYGRDTPDEARPTYDEAIAEYVTNYLFKAAASDGAYPRFVRDFMPAYQWDGRDVPSARMGGDNPDNCYRLAGIAHGGRYRVTVRPTGPEPANTSFTLTANFGTSVTVQTIEAHQMTRDADGAFAITIDDQPAAGRSNHMTTAPHVKFLYIRELFEDWETECSYALTIERMDAVDTPPLTAAEMADRAAFRAIEDVPLYAWFQRMFSGLPINTIRKPQTSASVGGLVTQAGVLGWFNIAPDEGVLVRYQPAGAAYVSIELSDWWFRSADAHLTQSSLTSRQSVVDPDGWITAVAAREDPGVANWLDTSGFATILFMMRWQGLPASPVNGGPDLDTRVIKLADLPADLRRTQAIDPAGRAQAIARRRAAWDRRTTIDLS